MDITIRNAAPADAPFLAWVMLAAARSHRPYCFWEEYVGGSERDALNFLEKMAVTKTGHMFRYDIFLIAQHNGRPVAGLSGYDAAERGQESVARALAEVQKDLGWTLEEAEKALLRLSSFLSCAPDDQPGVWTVESVAAAPEVRRQGVATRLLDEIVSKGRSLGYEKAKISILIGNTPARKAYEKFGFRYADEKRDPDFAATYGDAGIARLILKIP